MDAFTGKVVHTWSFDNFKEIFQSGPFRGVIWRTVWIAAAVTATCAVLAFPFAYFMARLASPRVRAMLFVLVLLPLWSSYLVRVYAWKVILANDGILNWSLEKIGLPGANIGYSNTAMWLVFTYIWLPFMILPVFAALERIPHSYIEASRDLGASGFTTLRRVILPAGAAGRRRGLDLHVLVDARRLHHADARRRRRLDLHRQHRLLDGPGRVGEPALRGGVRGGPARRDGHLPRAGEADGRVRGALMGETRATRVGLWIWTIGVVLFLHLPIVIIILYAFNASIVQGWPITDWTTKWFGPAIHDGEFQDALVLSLKAAALATGIAMVLGTLAAFALYRASFFGRTMISFLFILPIALPGIITGMALNSYFTYWGQTFGLLTIIVGHATFCIVIVFNNVVARLRRLPSSLAEASMDLGADGIQTFLYVTLPAISTALISGALLAFALSFDEVIVTTFTAGVQNTLPIWIFGNIRLGQKLPEVNVVVFLILLATIIPVALAQRLTRESGILRTE